LPNLEAFVAVVFDEIVQTFAQWLEHEAHVAHVAVALLGFVRESFFQVDDSAVAPSLGLQIFQNLGLKLRAIGVPRHCAHHFYRVGCLALWRCDRQQAFTRQEDGKLSTFKRSSEGAIAQMVHHEVPA